MDIGKSQLSDVCTAVEKDRDVTGRNVGLRGRKE